MYPPPQLLKAHASSHPGRERSHNEDLAYANVEAGLFLVIDGMGGEAAGEVAAEIAHDLIIRRIQQGKEPAPVRLREAITLANNEIYWDAQDHPERAGMGCVVTVVLTEGECLTVGHVGDTRLYKARGSTLTKLTRDHSPVGQMEEAGLLEESQAMTHPRRHEVLRDLGGAVRQPRDEGFIDIVEADFEEDAALLLCSDGLTDQVPITNVERVLQRYAGRPALATRKLIAMANDAGGRDNVSVVVVEQSGFAHAQNSLRVGTEDNEIDATAASNLDGEQ